jgi:leucine dehydrogenase
MLDIQEIAVDGYEKVIEAQDPSVGLHCFIAIHNCTLGPSLGGTRIFPYLSPEDALADVLRLAKAMTYKSALSQNGLGGGKSVIIADPKIQKTEALLRSFGEVINSLKGRYIAAEDVGTNTEDMAIIKSVSPYVCALSTDKSSGDPSRFTAWGVFKGMQAVSKTLWHTRSLRKRSIIIQGLGNVGAKLANILFWEGADLLLCDLDPQKTQDLCRLYGAQSIDSQNYFDVSCDIFAPCALGGIINEKTIPLLRCQAIAGGANNQLQKPEDGQLLLEKGILYAPDYIINSGGITNAAAEFDYEGYNPVVVRDKVNQIHDRLISIFRESEKQKKATNQIADEVAEYNIEHKIGLRQHPIRFDQPA